MGGKSAPATTPREPLPDDWRHPGVIAKLMARHALTRESAEALFDDLALFLDCGARAPVGLTPNGSIDDAWHIFILYTEDYADYCENRFGRIIHHLPHHFEADAEPLSVIEDRDEARRASAGAFGELVGSLRPRGWPYHRMANLLSALTDPVVQAIVLELLDDLAARTHFFESPVGWLGERRQAISDETHLTLFDFFGGGLRHVRDWPGVTDRVRAAALENLLDQADVPAIR